ncbi:MAG: prolipoprotein diacylglyceryl transferase [Cytophagaceae bacterium]|nr:prolipoprotein diacylglyceryl transferase [Cytophagaceae bacterium]MDW8456493.1 prolipoprotein diacylglyceryl transferase [Cytophagaceae bacterium]
MLSFINWDVSPEIFSLGFLSIRWYGLLFASGFLIGYFLMIKMYKQEGKSEQYVEVLTTYMVIATVIGARLGHCLFYEPEYFLANPIEILYVWQGGLASHGATIAILIALYLYTRKYKDQSYLYVLDRIVITIALAGACIRIGNLMNSEIIGEPTQLPFGFVFVHSAEERLLWENTNEESLTRYIKAVDFDSKGRDTTINGRKFLILNMALELRKSGLTEASMNQYLQQNIKPILALDEEPHDKNDHIWVPDNADLKVHFTTSKNGNPVINAEVYGIPRHPAQLYEALSCIALFILLYTLYNRTKAHTPEGRIFGLFLTILFTTRFLFEFLKESQVPFEDQMPLNMGQLLSLPFILTGIIILIYSYKQKKRIYR